MKPAHLANGLRANSTFSRAAPCRPTMISSGPILFSLFCTQRLAAKGALIMAEFFMSIIRAFARGFGWRLGSDAAREAEHIVEDEFK
jgi:hypothetical protein